MKYKYLACYFISSFFINHSTLTSSENWGATLCDEETEEGLLIKDRAVVKCRPWAISTTIPNRVTSIDGCAFSDCKYLTSVTIPESVTSIGYDAFMGCSGLTSVVSYIEEPFECYVFSWETYSTATLYVPMGSIDAYKATFPWSQFATILAMTDEDAIEKVEQAEICSEVARYDIQGCKINSLPSGRFGRGHINIIRYSDGTARKVLVK